MEHETGWYIAVSTHTLGQQYTGSVRHILFPSTGIHFLLACFVIYCQAYTPKANSFKTQTMSQAYLPLTLYAREVAWPPPSKGLMRSDATPDHGHL